MSSISDMVLEYLTSSEGLHLNSAVSQIIVTVFMLLIWILAGLLMMRIVRFTVRRAMRVQSKGPRAITISKLITNVFKYVVWFIVILMMLGELNVDITPIIASAGVVGLAVGFGAQEIVKDFISGFFILFEDSFNVSDVVEVDGFKGKVVSLGLRTTIIENWLGERKIINNGSIGSIVNCSRNKSVAIIDCGVGYNTDLEKLTQLMDEFAVKMKEKYSVIEEVPQFLGVTALADSSINIRLIAKTRTMEHFGVERGMRKDLIAFLGKHDIEIPFPQLVVHNE